LGFIVLGLGVLGVFVGIRVVRLGVVDFNVDGLDVVDLWVVGLCVVVGDL